MTNGRARRLSPDDIQSNRNALIGLHSLPDYQPLNAAFTTAALAELARAMDEAQQAENRALQALAAARDAAYAAEWALHEGILGAKRQVLAQYGADSHAVQLLGLKRRSARRRPVRRTAGAGS
ncbi:MAG TPA: hypothetical protein VNL77_13085 [Roseiflexaceae bacterium]|nr:hypothetical protein [Roseiflexaceae bacterium]